MMITIHQKDMVGFTEKLPTKFYEGQQAYHDIFLDAVVEPWSRRVNLPSNLQGQDIPLDKLKMFLSGVLESSPNYLFFNAKLDTEKDSSINMRFLKTMPMSKNLISLTFEHSTVSDFYNHYISKSEKENSFTLILNANSKDTETSIFSASSGALLSNIVSIISENFKEINLIEVSKREFSSSYCIDSKDRPEVSYSFKVKGVMEDERKSQENLNSREHKNNVHREFTTYTIGQMFDAYKDSSPEPGLVFAYDPDFNSIFVPYPDTISIIVSDNWSLAHTVKNVKDVITKENLEGYNGVVSILKLPWSTKTILSLYGKFKDTGYPSQSELIHMLSLTNKTVNTTDISYEVKTYHKTIDEIINKNGHKSEDTCPLNIDIIPNTMGINLVSVDSISWQKIGNQLTYLTINFIPELPTTEHVNDVQ